MTEVEMTQTGAPQRQVQEAEADLARRLRAKAPEAGTQLYDQFAPRLYRFALTRLLGDSASAEEVVIESLAAAARDIVRFDPRRASLGTWLFGVTRREVNLEIRRQRRRKSVPAWAQEPLSAAERTMTAPDPAVAVTDKLVAQRQVFALTVVLSEGEMEVLVLRYVEDLTVEEIGKVIGRSVRAVHSMLHRARTKARERLVRDDGRA